jgi:hypothetical protein
MAKPNRTIVVEPINYLAEWTLVFLTGGLYLPFFLWKVWVRSLQR